MQKQDNMNCEWGAKLYNTPLERTSKADYITDYIGLENEKKRGGKSSITDGG